MKFESYDIAPAIKKSLAEAGFLKPTDIQYKSIPPILGGEDVMAIAQTGTGKTAAFAIPIIDLIIQMKKVEDEEAVKCLVLVPTRELAMQIAEVFQKLGKYTKVKTICITGGKEQAPQIAELEKGVDIIVATPGRMFDLIYQKHLKITKVEILVLDEADHMLDLGFINDIRDVKKFLHRKHQTLFFSATINEEIKDLAYSLVRNPIRIQISPKDRVSKNIDHSVALIVMDDKRFFLERLVKENPLSKILVFVRTQVRAERVFKAMERVGIKTLTMHGGKEQEDRLSVLKDFKSGEVKVLIATDISARGIDIPNVEYVINYDLPDEVENYVHRVGRTGRGVNKGIAFSFCSPEEKEILAEIEAFLEKPVKVIDIDKNDYADTLDFTEDINNDWKSLIKEAEEDKKKKKGKKK
ncbi:MAG TPA: DEAD/DEAH box helicase [Cytophagaceae bacterium]|jgi:ATP-dependent RNA helicase RhlE|nr:DEAD/DEAH box helicase [Cytophagaceae bacterium]